MSVTGVGDGAVVVQWRAPEALPVDYRVMWARADLDFLSYRLADEAHRGNAYPAGDVTSLRLEGLTAGAGYKVRVRARWGRAGKSDWTAVATGAATAPAPAPADTDIGTEADPEEDEGDAGTQTGTEPGAENEAESASEGGASTETADTETEGASEEDEGDVGTQIETDADTESGDDESGTEGQGSEVESRDGESGSDDDESGSESGDGESDVEFVGGDFGFEAVLGVGSMQYQDAPVWGFTKYSAKLGSFEITTVADPADADHIGTRGFVNLLAQRTAPMSLDDAGSFSEMVLMQTSGQLAVPFVVEIGGRRYGSGEASLANWWRTTDGHRYSHVYWVWNDPCAAWADGASLPVTWTPGDYTDAALGGADTALGSLSLDGATLSGAFDAATADYRATADAGVTQITVDAEAADANACGVQIAPADADPGTDGHQIDIDPDTGAVVTVTVTAGDQTTTAGYTVTVAAPLPPDGDVTLRTLTLSEGAYTPALDDTTTLYAASYPSTVKTVTVRAAPTHPDATVLIGPADADPDTGGHQVKLRSGDNPITIRVISSDNTASRTHILTLTRTAPANPAPATLDALSANVGTPISFDPDTEWYWVPDIGTAPTHATIEWELTDPGARITVTPPDADPDTDGHQVAIGTPNTNVALTVEAADGATARTYTIALYRDIRWVKVVSGYDHFCGLRSNGQAHCWGGQVYSSSGWHKSITWAPSQDVYRDVYAGPGHSCGTHTDGRFHCWTEEGALGLQLNGTVDGGDTGIVSMDVHYFHTYCWLDEHARVQCNGSGSRLPAEVQAGRYQMISSGNNLHCAVDVTGGLACWGGARARPVPVGNFKYVSARWDRVCAIELSGALVCWRYGSGGRQAFFEDDTRSYVDTDDHVWNLTCAVTTEGDVRCANGVVVEGDYVKLATSFFGNFCAITTVGDMDCQQFYYNRPLYHSRWNAPDVASDARLRELRVAGRQVALSDSTTAYTVEVPSSQATADIAAQPWAASAAVTVAPADADSAANGHQAALSAGANTVTVTVVSENGSNSRTYTITVNRAG